MIFDIDRCPDTSVKQQKQNQRNPDQYFADLFLIGYYQDMKLCHFLPSSCNKHTRAQMGASTETA